MTSTQRSIAILFAATLAAWPTVTCVETSTVTCADDTRCPAGHVCVEQLDDVPACVPAVRVYECVGKKSGELCRYDGESSLAACREGICTLMVCGNGHVDQFESYGEACDDGNSDDGDGCNSNCQAACDDGSLQLVRGEVCDDGNRDDGDGCSSDCQRECGNGVVQFDQGELCDVAVPLAESCMDREFDMGRLECAPSCQEVSTTSCIRFDSQLMPEVQDGWHLARIWVFSSTRAMAVGFRDALPQDLDSLSCTDCGAIFEYDGAEWRQEPGAFPMLLDLWAEDPDDVYAVGVSGNIWHYDGLDWTSMSVEPEYHLGAIWGTGTGTLFAVGTRWNKDQVLPPPAFTILRYDGVAWIPMNLSRIPCLPSSSSGLLGVWGSGPDNVFAVGSHDTILHYDGNSDGIWTCIATPTSSSIKLLDVWGAHAGDVTVVGDDGTILHYDGQDWSQVTSPTQKDLIGVSGLPDGQIFAVGADGTLLEYDPAAGAAWKALVSGTSSDLLGIHGTSADDVVAVGMNGTALRPGAGGWEAMDVPGNASAINDLWGTGAHCIHAVARNGGLWHYDGNPERRWTRTKDLGEILMRSVHGVACDRDVFAVGDRILRYHDRTWTEMPIAGGGSHTLKAVWAAAPDAVFAVGSDGVILHYDGNPEQQWKPMASGTPASLNGVWGTAADDVLAVGNLGTILRYDGESWTPMTSGVNWMLNSVWGTGPKDVFAVGEGGARLHYDGETWTTMTTDARTDGLYAVWGSSSGDDVFASSTSGALLHYDGHGWSPMRSPTKSKIRSIWVTPGGAHLFAPDNRGNVFRLAVPQPPRKAED